MKYELPSIELIVIEENNYLKFGEYLNDMQCDDTPNKLSLDDLEYGKKVKQENRQVKDKWEIIRQYCLDEQIPEESDEYNSYIEFSNSVYDNILNKMQELQGNDSDEN